MAAAPDTVARVRPPEAIRGPDRLLVQGALARLTAKRDISVLSNAVDEHDEHEARQKADYEAHAKTLADPTAARNEKTTRRTKLYEGTEKRLRQRERSPHLYDRLLALVDEVCREAPTLQVIITTTTSPPEPLREPPTRILRPSRASDDDLLLKRRVENLLARAAPSSPDASEEEEP